MTLATARIQGMELLDRGGIAAPMLTAEVLLCHALGKERTYLYAHPEQELRQVEWLHFGRYLHERLQGKPTQYVTRRQEFYGREFRVSPDVLIPRPETEHLVELVLSEVSTGLLVDVGTGSGAIGVTLSLESQCTVIGTDLSAPALLLAQSNSVQLHAPVNLLQMDLLSGFSDRSLDAVVSNPPYVPESQKDGLSREVREFEPHLALFGGPTGLEIYRRLVPEAQRVLRSGGLLAMEIGFGEWDAIEEMLSGWSNPRVLPDLAGIPRVALARKP